MKHTNVRFDHPFLNDVLGVEAINKDVSKFDEHHYDGLPWANGFNYQVIKPAKITEFGVVGFRRPIQSRKGVSE